MLPVTGAPAARETRENERVPVPRYRLRSVTTGVTEVSCSTNETAMRGEYRA